jgi:hypothetical protein
LVRPDRILSPITSSAAVMASLGAGVSAVVMITCRSTHQGRDRRKTVKDAVAFGPPVMRMLAP